MTVQVNRPKYSLVGIDGNAFSVMGYVIESMRREKYTKQEIDEYKQEAQSSDYNNLLNVSFLYIEDCNSRYFERVNNF